MDLACYLVQPILFDFFLINLSTFFRMSKIHFSFFLLSLFISFFSFVFLILLVFFLVFLRFFSFVFSFFIPFLCSFHSFYLFIYLFSSAFFLAKKGYCKDFFLKDINNIKKKVRKIETKGRKQQNTWYLFVSFFLFFLLSLFSC